MAVDLDGTGYLEWDAGTMPHTGMPFTPLAFVTTDGATGAQQCIVASLKNDGSVANYMTIGNSGDSIQVSQGSATAVKSGVSISSTVFRLAAAEFLASNSRKAYFDGSATPGADTGNDSGSIATHNRICIGGYHYNSSVIFPYVGSIAEVHIIVGSLVPAELDAVKAGTIKPNEMTGHVDGWQLKSITDLVSMSGTRTLTLVGGVTNSALAHPVDRSGGGGGGSVKSGMHYYNRLLGAH